MVTPQRLLLTCAKCVYLDHPRNLDSFLNCTLFTVFTFDSSIYSGTNGSVKCVVTLEGDRLSGGVSYFVIIPMLFVTVVLIGQKQN
jgi:hypothetical protein